MNNEKTFQGIHVLLMEASSRSVLPMARSFYNLGCEVTTVSGSKWSLGNLTKFKNNSIVINGIDDNEEIAIREYERLASSRKYDLFVPLSDFTAILSSKMKKTWESLYGIKIAVNEWSVFQNIADKNKTMKICEDNGIPAPITIYSNNPIEEIKVRGISYPVVVKPRTGIGSIGFNIISNEASLTNYLSTYDNENGPLVIQEYIEQNGAPQYGGEIFRDRDGIIRAAMITRVDRWYPIDGGSRLCSTSIHDSKIAESCIKLVNVLNWNGYANVDLVWDDKKNEAKILEINGRTGASVKLDMISGVDIGKLILENEFGKEVTSMINYSDGKQISCFLVDVLWFLKSKTRFTSKPSWFARWKISDVIFSVDDILPSIGFVITSFISYRKAMGQRKRFET